MLAVLLVICGQLREKKTEEEEEKRMKLMENGEKKCARFPQFAICKFHRWHFDFHLKIKRLKH